MKNRLLNKIKHSQQGQDVQYVAADFEGKPVNQTELVAHLNHLIREGSIEGEAETSNAADAAAPLAICKNARITPAGENLVRVKYFKV